MNSMANNQRLTFQPYTDSIPPQFMAHIYGEPWKPRKQSIYQHLQKYLILLQSNYRNMDSLPHSLIIPEEDHNFKALGLAPIFFFKLRMYRSTITIIRKFFTNSSARNIRQIKQERSSTINSQQIKSDVGRSINSHRQIIEIL